MNSSRVRRFTYVSVTLALSVLCANLALSSTACTSKTARSGFETEKKPTETMDEGGVGFATGDAGALNPCSANNDTTAATLDKDFDGDGFPLRHDCNECDPQINEGALDVAGNGIDEDCNGTADDEPETCDDGLPIDPTDPFDAAKALGLCKKANAKGQDWGVVSARYVRPDGSPTVPNIDVGILTKFGINAPQAGKSMLVLSSGFARAPGDPSRGHDPLFGQAPLALHPQRYRAGSRVGPGHDDERHPAQQRIADEGAHVDIQPAGRPGQQCARVDRNTHPAEHAVENRLDHTRAHGGKRRGDALHGVEAEIDPRPIIIGQTRLRQRIQGGDRP